MSEEARILLVDDEEDFVEMLSLRLMAQGMDVTGVHSGPACLEALDESAFDVVILDLKMPGMDGLEVLRRIKQAHPGVEVIIMTGHGAVESATEGRELGAFDYLIKPADFDELLEKIEAARKGRKAAQ